MPEFICQCSIYPSALTLVITFIDFIKETFGLHLKQVNGQGQTLFDSILNEAKPVYVL